MNSSGLQIQIQSGGKQLAEGAYGCVFSPPLTCLGKTKATAKKNMLGKLTGYGDLKNEVISAKYLKQFGKSPEYCILPELSTICAPDLKSPAAQKTVENCDVLQKEPDKEHFQFDIRYGGPSLKNTLLNITPSFKTFPFFTFMQQLLEIGAFFVIHGFIHNDMHAGNIVLADDIRPRVIDFGRAFIHDKINHDVVEELKAGYDPSFGHISPETSAEHGVDAGVPFATIVNDIYKKKPALEWGEKVLGISRKAQIEEFKQFWLTSKAVQENDWVTFYKLYWPAVDSWAIGNCLLKILRMMNVSQDFSSNAEWVQKRGVVKQVLRGLLRASPKLRLDAMQALAIYDPMNDLVSGASGRAWLEKK